LLYIIQLFLYTLKSVWLDWRSTISETSRHYAILERLDSEITNLKIWEDEAKQEVELNNLDDPTLVRLKCEELLRAKEENMSSALETFSRDVQQLESSFPLSTHLSALSGNYLERKDIDITPLGLEAVETQYKNELELRKAATSEIEALLSRNVVLPTIMPVWDELKRIYYEKERLSALDKLHRRRAFMAEVLARLDSSEVQVPSYRGSVLDQVSRSSRRL
jgi:hypothetical protein